MDRILVLERVLAHAVICGACNYANLWLLPKGDMIGKRLGIHAEAGELPKDDGWHHWFYAERLKWQLPPLRHMAAGVIGSVLLKRVAKPRELGHMAFGPAVWVFSEPERDTPKGRLMRAGYSDQPHVKERDRLALGNRPESEAK